MSTEFDALMVRFRDRLEGELNQFLAAQRRASLERTPEADALLEQLRGLVLSGGKRLRPALVYFSYLACEGPEEARVLPLAMATELLHTYLLIHDDIMDHADTRRGHPTSHVHFRERYQREGWPGGEAEAQEYGNSMAILAGDVAHTYADQLFASVETDPERRFKLQRIYYSMCREVIDGQYLELHMGLGGDPSEDDLRRVLRLKSGLYSVERPLQLGAILAGAGPRRYEALSHYGSAMGEAFQLQDDILGIFGDPNAVGKPVGGDLLEGKFTFLIHHTLRLAAAPDAERLRQGLGRRDLPPQEVEELCAVIRDSGGLAAVEAMVARRSREARDVIQGLDLAPAGKAFLLGLIGYLGARSH